MRMRFILGFAVFFALAACASSDYGTISGRPSVAPHYKIGQPYQIKGRWYHPAADPHYDETGVASWYGDAFHGRATANGEIFNMDELTAAHPTLPMPSIVEVENLRNGRRIQVRVNDRGPFAHDRIIDLSRAAARALDFEREGTTNVRVRFVSSARLPGEEGPRYAARDSIPPMRTPDTVAAPTAGTSQPVFMIALEVVRDLNAIQFADLALSPSEEVRLANLVDGSHQLEIGPYFDIETAQNRLAHVREAGYVNAYLTEAARARSQAGF